MRFGKNAKRQTTISSLSFTVTISLKHLKHMA